MADNNEEEAKATEGLASSSSDEAAAADLTTAPEDGVLNPDQSFAYWLVMLPFLVIAGVCVYNFYQSPGNFNQLWNALGAVVVGVFAASFVNALTGDHSTSPDEANPETPKPEGSS